jgi:ribonucleoside-triphosphate reductase
MSPVETKRQPCEVYSRVCGYLRPVGQWNDSKQAEFMNRKMFKAEKSEE